MSQEHVLFDFTAAFRQYMADETNAGRITPPIKAIEEYIDWNNHTAFPALRLHIEGRMRTSPSDQFEYGAKFNIGAAVSEPNAKLIQRAAWSFEQDIIEAIRRCDGYFQPGVYLTYRATSYKMRARDGKAPIALAEIQYALVYKEVL